MTIRTVFIRWKIETGESRPNADSGFVVRDQQS
jgi:hypothetical protein